MNTRDQATFETLMRQAPMTVHEYFTEAIEIIDKTFGEGYAEKHPALIGSFIQAAAVDYQAGVISATLETIGNDLVETIGEGFRNMSGL
jgi:hypothetical protein